MTDKEYKKKANLINVLCLGIPAVEAVAVLPFIHDAGFWNCFCFELVYVGIQAYVLSKIYETAMTKLERLRDM